jgi:hypothetical protein
MAEERRGRPVTNARRHTAELVELNSRLTPVVSIGTAIGATEPEQPPSEESARRNTS